MLTARVESDPKDGLDPDPEPEPHLLALNDVVIHKWNTARMIELKN